MAAGAKTEDENGLMFQLITKLCVELIVAGDATNLIKVIILTRERRNHFRDGRKFLMLD
jgi:hypothetical protein